MKKILISIISIIVLMGVIYFALLYSSERLDKLALSETKKVINEIERIQVSNKEFPEDIEKFFNTYGFRKKIRFGLLSTEIKIFRHEGSHFIEYHQAPFGPFYGYSFKSKEWYSTE